MGNAFYCRICELTARPEEVFLAINCFRCAGCGTVQSIELPTVVELESHYASYSENYTAGMGSERFNREMPKRHAAKLALVHGYLPSGKLLDIGCGEGFFLQQASEAGYQCVGCDYSLRERYPNGVSVVPGVFDKKDGLPFGDGDFDIVTSWAVVEHLRDPHAAMQEVSRVLRPGGYFFCDTPLCGDLCERLVAGRSHWFCPPQHIHVLSQRALKLVIQKAGLEVLLSTPSFERTRIRWWARRLRNIGVGLVAGGLARAIRRKWWLSARQYKETPIGDIQLAVAQKRRS